MSTIQLQSSLFSFDSGINLSSTLLYSASEANLASNSTTLLLADGDEVVPTGDIISPRCVALRLLSGDDILIGFDGSDYPLRLSGTGDNALLRLDVEGVRNTSTVTAIADYYGSLSGKYFDLTDANGVVVRVWFNTSGAHEQTSVTCVADTAGSLSGKHFDMDDSDGPVRVWFDVSGGSTPPSAPVSGRLIEVNITTGDANTAVATALAAALDADAKFIAGPDGADVDIVDVATGTRTNAVDGAAPTGFTISTTVQGMAASTTPADDPERLLPVSFAINATADTVATAIAAAVDGDSLFSSSSVSSLVTMTDLHTGTRTPIDVGTSGMSVATSQSGAASPVVHYKSTGTSQVITAVAPA